jgi:hypothetical protein
MRQKQQAAANKKWRSEENLFIVSYFTIWKNIAHKYLLNIACVLINDIVSICWLRLHAYLCQFHLSHWI